MSDDEDYSFVRHDDANKRCSHTLRKHSTFRPENVNFLLRYFQDSKPPTSMAPPQVHQILKAMNISCLHSKRSLLKTNKIQGALIYPEFNLLVQYGAANVHFICDHLAFDDSPCNRTPAIRDVVINAVNAKSGELYFESNGIFTQ
jgi:hypothetical protein